MTISPEDIKREIERETCCAVGFQWTPFYIEETDEGGVRMDFAARGHGVMVKLTDADLALPMADLTVRIIRPAVHRWKSLLEA